MATPPKFPRCTHHAMFHKILIANRGEIACRIIATARKMGIRSVAVYSDADKQARHTTLAHETVHIHPAPPPPNPTNQPRHTTLADEAVHIGPAPARASYLLAERIIAACRQTGAQAVHPG